MVFPTVVQGETLVPQFRVGMWGRALGTGLSRLLNIIVRFLCLIPAWKSAQLRSSVALWRRGNLQQPDSSVQAGADSKAGEAAAKVFPSQRAAQKRLFLEAPWHRDFALSSLKLNEFVFGLLFFLHLMYSRLLLPSEFYA